MSDADAGYKLAYEMYIEKMAESLIERGYPEEMVLHAKAQALKCGKDDPLIKLYWSGSKVV